MGCDMKASEPNMEPQEQLAIVGGRQSVRRYWLLFDSPLAPGPGCLVRSSRIGDSWGMRPRLEQDPTFRRTLQCYSLVYVYRGNGTYYDTRGSRPVRSGDVICLFPGVAHAYGPDADERWDEINVEFSGPAFDAWCGPGMLDPDEPCGTSSPWAIGCRGSTNSWAPCHGRMACRRFATRENCSS